MQRAAKSFFFSFFQGLHLGLGTLSSSCFLLLYKALHQSASSAGPLMSGPSLPLPLGEASLLRIKRGVKLRWPLACPGQCGPLDPWTLRPKAPGGGWRDQHSLTEAPVNESRGPRGPERARATPGHIAIGDGRSMLVEGIPIGSGGRGSPSVVGLSGSHFAS